MHRLTVGVALLLAVVTLAGVASAATQPKVTLIGDSVADSLEHNDQALASLNKGFRVYLQTRGCRRLRAPSCVIEGSSGPAPTTLEVVKKLGPYLGRTVVVNVGYNDTPTRYGRDLDAVMRALAKAGVETVIWLTLRDPNRDYAASNAVIRSEPREWPKLIVLDWDEYAAGRPTWFRDDGIHLTQLGATKLATFINRGLVRYAGS